MTHPSHAHFLLFCEEDLPSGMFLSGGRLTNFLDSGFGRYLNRRYLEVIWKINLDGIGVT